jgi:basic membrane protein A
MYFSGPDVRYGSNFNQSTGETAADVLADYKAEFGEAPAAPFWAHSYDATTLLLDAIAAASYDDGGTLIIDRAGVREYLNGVTGYSGLIGTMACDAFGDCSSSKITVIQNIDTGDYDASTANVVYEYAPLGASQVGDIEIPAGACVGLVTDVGQVDDKSFNQSAWDGVQAVGSSLGVDVDYIETQAAKDYATNIGLFADSGCDVIVTVGFALGEATAIAAAENPDVDFIGVDQWQPEAIDNVAGLIFPEDQAGFLAGALAASLSTSGVIAEVLGTDLVPPVVAFGEGFVNGAKHINPGIQVIKTYHPGGLDVAFTDPEWGATTARQALDQGADVVFGAGGKTGNGALIEVAGESGAFCIGVDSDQWETVPEAHPCLVSSAMKLITDGVVDLIRQSFAGSMPGGNYVGNVGLAGFHDHESSVPGDVQDMLVALKADLESGAVDACVWSDCDTPIAYDFGVTEDVIRVGAIADLSGVFAPLVIQIVDAQTAYWDMVNEAGGIAGRQVEFLVLDSAYDVPTHLERYEVMRDEDEGVVFLSQSTGSPHTAAIAEALVEDGLGAIPLSWYSGWPDPDFGQNVFESYTNYCYEAINGVDFMANNLIDGEGKLAVISLPGEYGQDGAAGAKIAAEALGIEVVYDGEGTVIPGADQTPVISGLLESGANMVWTTLTPGTFAEIFGGAGAQGFAAQWSGNSPTYNYMLLATPLAPLLDAYYTQSGYTLTWNAGDAPGMVDMVAELQARIPDKPLSDVYAVGWTEAMATHQILETAAAAGDLTRAGVIAAANSTAVDYAGLAPNQSYGGDANDYIVRESYMFDIQADLFDVAATVAGGGSTGSVLLGGGPIVSDITNDQTYEGACFVAG